MVFRATLVAFSLTATAALATTGNDLLGHCETPTNFSEGFCVGLIVGNADGQMMGLAVAGSATSIEAAETKLGYCYPASATNQQIKDIVVTFLKSHPERRHEWSGLLVLNALQEAFPC